MKDSLDYWRGFAYGQNKKSYTTEKPIVTAKDRKSLRWVSALVEKPIVEFRSGWYVNVEPLHIEDELDVNKVETLRGWFDAQGNIHKKKITISGVKVDEFSRAVRENADIDLPKSQKPSPTSESRRIIVTGEKMVELLTYLGHAKK